MKHCFETGGTDDFTAGDCAECAGNMIELTGACGIENAVVMPGRACPVSMAIMISERSFRL